MEHFFEKVADVLMIQHLPASNIHGRIDGDIGAQFYTGGFIFFTQPDYKFILCHFFLQAALKVPTLRSDQSFADSHFFSGDMAYLFSGRTELKTLLQEICQSSCLLI